jgi:hypothetical protein
MAGLPAPVDWQPWLALLKSLSLGYLLALGGLALCGALWRGLAPRVAPPLRADALRWLLLGAVTLQALTAALIWRGVVRHEIRMTTHYFHHLMYGGWGLAITWGGLLVLAASLLIAAYGWRRGHARARAGALLGRAGKLGIHSAPEVGCAQLSGVVRPLLLVNPQWWETLDDAARRLTVAHELEHLRRGDNLAKLLLEALAACFAVLPAARHWGRSYELDCELAVDDRLRRIGGDGPYRDLLLSAARFAAAAPARHASPASALGSRGLGRRLEQLAAPQGGPALPGGGTVLAGWLLSVLPHLLLLSHPVPRCFLACYLGY